MKGLDDERINAISRMAMLNRGDTQIVLYDVTSGKYSAMRDVKINPSERVLARLYELFTKECVVLS